MQSYLLSTFVPFALYGRVCDAYVVLSEPLAGTLHARDPSLLKAAAVFPEHRCILSHTHNTAVMSGSASTLVCNVLGICILFELTQ